MSLSPALATAQRVLADQSVTRMFGTRLVSFGTEEGDGSAVIELDIRPEITNHHGAVHGGILAYAADTALAFAGGAALGPDVVTSGLTIDYLAPARGSTLRAHGMVMRAAGRRAACRCELVAIAEDGAETLVAVAQGTIVAPEETSEAHREGTVAQAEKAATATRKATRRLGRIGTPTIHQVLAERRRTRDNDDGATVALVIEGGGMRGIVSAAMAAVLEQEGVLESVDMIVGTSAGAVNAAALAVGAAGAMAESYAEVFASPEFIDVRRIVRGQPVIDGSRIVSHVDHLLDIGSAVGTDWAGRLAMVATDVDTGRAEALTDFTDRDDLIHCLHASGLLPLLAGDPVVWRDRRWLDGGIVEAVPVVTAAARGATHAIVLATRPAGTQPAYGAADVVVERYLRRLNPELAAAYRGRPHRYRETLQQVRDGWSHGLSTVALTPRLNDPLPARLERDQAALRAARAAAGDVARVFLGELR
ncbi:patatin-like phospholipase family protein [Actinoplanes sp. NEAU-A12]|uniref:Patatin-like phospholipase family protein n=1 Tax=Actinoplanes sandaracinus TaxID=3045177 RepID=A0ABT6WYF0_9ACTN|nr:patatin-like phospholipase family protein [Actinoplanes sandaracinus]MDI6104704.1 patatin-like phospholipase family protein [Actinoplanes sandaracinus]